MLVLMLVLELVLVLPTSLVLVRPAWSQHGQLLQQVHLCLLHQTHPMQRWALCVCELTASWQAKLTWSLELTQLQCCVSQSYQLVPPNQNWLVRVEECLRELLQPLELQLE
jgi:hypothetical protein